MAIVPTPSSFAARITRMAISPRLAISSRRILCNTLVGQIRGQIVLEAAALRRLDRRQLLQRLLYLGLEFARALGVEGHRLQAVLLVFARHPQTQRREALVVLAQLAEQPRRRGMLDILELQLLLTQRHQVRSLPVRAVKQLADPLHRIEQLRAP